MNVPVKKQIRIFSFALSALIILIVTGSVIVSLTYEKAIIRYLKTYLDEHLLTQLSMDEIRFKTFSGFPNATIEITNVTLLSGKDFSAKDFKGPFADTLLKADKVLLQFDLLKLIRKTYELKKIEISGGSIQLLYDLNNRSNTKVWKSNTSDTVQYAVDLKSISLISTSIRLRALKSKIDLQQYSVKTNFRGNYSKGVLSGTIHSDSRLQSLIIKDQTWLSNEIIRLETNLVYGSSNFHFQKGFISINKAKATFKGAYNSRLHSIQLSTRFEKFGLAELMSIIPYSSRFRTENYVFGGSGKFNIILSGSLSDINKLLIKSEFNIKNGSARNRYNRSSVTNINARGSISGTNRKNFILIIDTLQAEMGKGSFSGNFELTRLDLLNFRTGLHAGIDLNEFRSFAGLDTLELLKGFVRADFIASGSLRSIQKDSFPRIIDFIQKGVFDIENAGIRFKNWPVSLDEINGKVYMADLVRLDSVTLKLNETSLMVTGSVNNLTNYLLTGQMLHANLEIETEQLNLGKYINQPSTSKSASGYKSLSVFPPNILLHGHLKAAHFEAGKFKATDLHMNISALKDSVYIDAFSFRFPDGKINGSAKISLDSQKNLGITCYAQTKEVNIQQLFYSFNNFSQHFIIEKNIRGLLNGDVSFYSKWDSTLKFIPASMKAKGDFIILNGELIQFEPMQKLSKYIDLEELKHIRFKTLKNTIYISDRIVSIPEMAIHSSAFNISASGVHNFDNKFDYRVKVLLSEVLFNKTRKKKKEIDDFLIEENVEDQTTIPLVIAGTPDNFDVKLDRKKAFSLTRNKMNQSEEQKPLKPTSDQFKIEWEEPVDQKINEKAEKPVSDSENDITIEWEE